MDFLKTIPAAAECADDRVAPGQPCCLRLLEGLAIATADPDTELHPPLQNGVRTGCVPEFPVPPSGVWLPAKAAMAPGQVSPDEGEGHCPPQLSTGETEHPDGPPELQSNADFRAPTTEAVEGQRFLVCDGNWATVTASPEEALPLVEEDVKKGFVR